MKRSSSLAALAAALAGVVAATAPNAAPQSAAPTFHIELNTLPGCYRSGCNSLFSNFRDKDISVVRNGVTSPVLAEPGNQSSFPTHLLVVFAEGVERPGNAELAGMLKQPLGKNWLVSAARADGSFTRYCNKDTLDQALAEASAPLSDNRVEGFVPHRAIAELESFPGRRVLLFINAPGKALPNWVSEAAGELAPVYVVDGGDRRKAYYRTSDWGAPLDWETEVEPQNPASQEPAPQVCNWKMVKARLFENGIMHEVKLSSAMKDIAEDSRYDYDLSFSMPASDSGDAAVPSPIRVELTTRKIVTVSAFPIAIPDSAIAGLYAVTDRKRGGSSARTRVALPQDLSVIWRCSFGQNPSVLFRIGENRPQIVLPSATKPHGTVLVPYSDGAGLGMVSNVPSAAPQTLRIGMPSLLGWNSRYICE